MGRNLKVILPEDMMPDGIVKLDTMRGLQFGFISDHFEGYLWKERSFIWISLIISKFPNRGNTTRLLNRIEALGYGVIVPTPSHRMLRLCGKRGMNYYCVGGMEFCIREEYLNSFKAINYGIINKQSSSHYEDAMRISKHRTGEPEETGSD